LNRKLVVLDVVLAAGVVYGGFQLHSEWAAAKARQAGMPGPAPKGVPTTIVPPLKQQPSVLPSDYQKIAVNTLFDPSRSPDVVQPPPPPPPPPPAPPPLPFFHGMMDFGDPQGPIALITAADSPGHLEVHAGEMIGPFKLLSFDRQEMRLEWDGRVIHARLNAAAGDAAKDKPAAAEMVANNGVIPGQAPPQGAEQPKPQGQELPPGQDMTDTVKACQAGDSSPAGTVNSGYRKEINMSPLGAQCLWRAIGR